MADLLSRMSRDFDLVICLVGSAACNPQLEGLLATYWDDRFFFSEWDQDMMSKLLNQQEELLSAGLSREVLLILDDVILSSKAEEQICHMAMRGRHFRISLAMCSVSYTTLPKRARRSLDTLLVFSCPMKGDMQILTYEYCQNHMMARFAMNALKDYECLVLETLEKKQSMFIWKAQLLGRGGDQNTELSSPSESETTDVVETPQERPQQDHRRRISSEAPNNESEATDELVLQDRNK